MHGTDEDQRIDEHEIASICPLLPDAEAKAAFCSMGVVGEDLPVDLVGSRLQGLQRRAQLCAVADDGRLAGGHDRSLLVTDFDAAEGGLELFGEPEHDILRWGCDRASHFWRGVVEHCM